MISRRVLGILAGVAMFGGLAVPAAAQDEAAFFKGKTIRLAVGFGPGGEGNVRFALIENDQRIQQAIRGMKKALPELG